jgi:hypothetical protein
MFRHPYRPERHYMRGPGPKWHEKHREAFHVAASVQPKDDAERELLARSAQTIQPAAKKPELRYVMWIVPITIAAVVGAVAVALASGLPTH